MADTMRAKLDLIAAQHMCQFGSIGFGQKFPHPPSEAAWGDFSPTEQSAARHLTNAVLDALMGPTDEVLQAFEDEFVIQFGAAPSNPWTRGEKLLGAMLSAAKEGQP